MSILNAPAAPGERIASIDALRGFALVGILLVNIVAFGAMLDWPQPFGRPDLANPDWRIWLVQNLFIEGAMRGLFSMLFGAGMLLFLREAQGAEARAGRTGLFVKRSLWLVGFGAVNGTLLLWPGDILLVYGLAAFVILPFAKLRERTLLVVAAITLAVLSVWAIDVFGVGKPEILTRETPGYLAEKAVRTAGYLTNLVYISRLTWDWTFDISTVWWVLEAAAFMLIGMALLRLGILNGKASTRFYGWMAAVGFGVALPLNAVEVWAMWKNLGAATAGTELTSQIGRTAHTLGYIGLFHLAWRALPIRLFAPLAAHGRMALTGYLGQSLVCALLFGGFGLGLWGKLNWPQLWLLVLAIAAAQAAFAMLWLRVFRFGPVEWLWRSLTYGRRQPMLRAAAA
ncbi:DUF418 domain-containing protein [Caulobacter mirabilis]|uniref:DUF418 domain-containing protein n=1 Tax=Caulobacter mirabilis TaxID=69666 RepID=A0A2D2AU30_9CAUL|nr:DUF418 domain-containing protein [Caulobacter mirabilis]ATQ41518.1 hypothetical protein CSW64_03370 [Caulobacter mirabilis]